MFVDKEKEKGEQRREEEGREGGVRLGEDQSNNDTGEIGQSLA